MEFICLREDLQKGVQIVERVVSVRTTLPIVGNILFETTKNGLKLSANNLEVGVEIFIPAKIIKDGAVLVPAKTLAGIVAKLPPEEILFKLKDRGIINLSYKKSTFNLHGLPADEFPSIPKVKEDKSFKIESGILSKMVAWTVFSASTSEEKLILNGVLFDIEKKILRMVATDGFRLSCKAEKISDVSGETALIVPTRALNELNRILQLVESGEIKVVTGHDQISFRSKDFYLVSKTIQGKFPDYNQVVPKKSDTRVKTDSKKFMASAERVQVIAASSANIARFEVKGSELHMIASAPDVGNIEEILEVEVKGPEKKAIAFNIRLIIDALRVIGERDIFFEVSSPLSPGVLRLADGTDYIYIVMPIRTQETVTA